MRQKVAIIGCGAWATTVGNLMAKNGTPVTIWTHRDAYAVPINTHNENHIALPGIPLSANLTASTDFDTTLTNADLWVLATPSTYALPYITQLLTLQPKPLLSLVKGILDHPQWRISEFMRAKFTGDFGTLSGPNLASEIAKGQPAASVLASHSATLIQHFQPLLSSETFRIYPASDITGVELGGILKNVLAIAAGICDGLKLGENSKAAFITRSLKEMIKIGTEMGASPDTFYGLSGLGDLMATCYSPLSRNWKIGYAIGQNGTIPDLGHAIPEGIRTAKKIHTQFPNLDLPIFTQIHNILYENTPPKDAISTLMTRKITIE